MKRNPGPTHADFGSDKWNREHGLTHGSRPKSDRAKRSLAALKKADATMNAEDRAAKTWQAAQERAWLAVLGPTGHTRAVKLISLRAPFMAQDVAAYEDAGWNVFPAGSIPAKIGKPLAGLTRNPDADLAAILGPSGAARAVVIQAATAMIDREIVNEFLESGFDVAAAPKRYRDLERNPSADSAATRKAVAKARAWFRKDSLLTEPQTMPYTPPGAVVEIGTILALEYASNKFDGRLRAYRHDVTQERRMFLSPDGSTIIVDPPFRITTRGIEG